MDVRSKKVISFVIIFIAIFAGIFLLRPRDATKRQYLEAPNASEVEAVTFPEDEKKDVISIYKEKVGRGEPISEELQKSFEGAWENVVSESNKQMFRSMQNWLGVAVGQEYIFIDRRAIVQERLKVPGVQLLENIPLGLSRLSVKEFVSKYPEKIALYRLEDFSKLENRTVELSEKIMTEFMNANPQRMVLIVDRHYDPVVDYVIK